MIVHGEKAEFEQESPTSFTFFPHVWKKNNKKILKRACSVL